MDQRLKNLAPTIGTAVIGTLITIYKILRTGSYSIKPVVTRLINKRLLNKPPPILPAEYIVSIGYRIYPFILYYNTSNGFNIYLRIIINNITFEIIGRRLFKVIILC